MSSTPPPDSEQDGEVSPRSKQFIDLLASNSALLASNTALTARVDELSQVVAGQQQPQSEAGLGDMIKALKEAVMAEPSSNVATKKFNAACSVLQKNMFHGNPPQQLRFWLQNSKVLLERSGVDQTEWGYLIMASLTTGPQQNLQANLQQLGAGEPDYSFSNVSAVLQRLHGERFTQSDLVGQLEKLVPDGFTGDAFDKFQADFLRVASQIEPDRLPNKGKCALVLKVLPGLVRTVTLLHLGTDAPEDLADTFSRARAQVQVFAQDAQALKPKLDFAAAASQPAAQPQGKGKAKVPHSGNSSDSGSEGRAVKARTGAQPSRLGSGSGLPVVSGKTPEEVLALVRQKKCAGCGSPKHHYKECPQNPNRCGENSSLCCQAQAVSPAVLPTTDSAGISVELPCSNASACMPTQVESRVLSHAALRRLQQRTKHFQLFVGCNPKQVAAPCISVDEFLESQPDGHILVNATGCSAMQARQ